MTKKLQGRILGCRSRFNFPAEEALVLVDVMARIEEWDGVSAAAVDIVGSRRLALLDGLITALELRLSTSEIDKFRPFFSSGMGTNVPCAT
ncbi:hypothetical protein PFUM301597_16130 [Pseudomonas fluorescens]